MNKVRCSKVAWLAAFWLQFLYLSTVAGQDAASVERVWLELLSRPVAGKSICFFHWSLRFGIHDIPFDYVVALKSGTNCWFLPDGTDRVYQLQNGPTGPHLRRIDSSTHSGSNYRTMPFLRHDTLFRFGGYGFWKTRDLFSWFDPSTGRWEPWLDAGGLPSALTLYQYEDGEDAFYLFGSSENRPHENFRDLSHDSLFRYDFQSRAWQCMGRLDRWRLDVNIASFTISNRICHAKFGVVRVTGPLAILMDLPAHTMTDMSLDRMARIDSLGKLHERNARSRSEECYIIMGDSLYTVVQDGRAATLFAIPIQMDMFDASTTRSFLAGSGTSKISSDGRPKPWWHVLWVSAFLIWSWYRREWLQSSLARICKIGRRVTAPVARDPAEEQKREENLAHFVSTLRASERELVYKLIQRSASGSVMRPQDLNRHLGILGKAPDIQKVSRNKAIQSINSAYRTVLQADVDLIERMRDPGDRRLVLYRIHPDHYDSLHRCMQPWEDGGADVHP